MSSPDSLPSPVLPVESGPVCWPLAAFLPLLFSLMAQEQKGWELHLLRHHCQLSGSANEVQSPYFEGWKEAYVFLPCQQWWRPRGLWQCQVLPQMTGLALPCLLPISGLQGCCDIGSGPHSLSTFGSSYKLLTLDHTSAWTWQLAEVPHVCSLNPPFRSHRHLLLGLNPLCCRYFDRFLCLTDTETTPPLTPQDERSAASFWTPPFSPSKSNHFPSTTNPSLSVPSFHCSLYYVEMSQLNCKASISPWARLMCFISKTKEQTLYFHLNIIHLSIYSSAKNYWILTLLGAKYTNIKDPVSTEKELTTG